MAKNSIISAGSHHMQDETRSQVYEHVLNAESLKDSTLILQICLQAKYF